MNHTDSAWAHALAVTLPALALAPPNFLVDLDQRLRDYGVQEAVARHDSAALFNWTVRLLALQGVSDAAAFTFDATHGGITHVAVAAALAQDPSCPRLRSRWDFEACGYRKAARTCAEPAHFGACPLPRHRLRKGGLNVAAYGAFLFFRDVCGGDVVAWIDRRLAGADPGVGERGRVTRMSEALVGPLTNIPNTGPKLWSMILAELLLAGDPGRERWVAAGASLIAIDTLVHAHLHRTGTLRRLGADHPYGEACYGPTGCAAIIVGLADRIDARAYNSIYPACFPRFVQHALWAFCSTGGWNICNGNRIDDQVGCRQPFCPSGPDCDRLPYQR